MEDIITQKFSFATITVFKDYCKLTDGKKSLNSKSVDLETLDEDEEELNLKKFNIFFEDLNKPKVGRIVEFPEKMGNRKTKFFYGVPGVNESTTINYAINRFETRNDRHIKRHYGNPFSEISVNTIERSIRRHGDKVTIKIYRHHTYRGFNCIYFKKNSSVQSVTFNLVNGNFTTLTMDKAKKTSKLFRTNCFSFLEQMFKSGGILDMRKCLDDKSVLLDDYNKTFNNSDFIYEIDKLFKFNQNFVFNGKWFLQLMLERFVELKKIKVSNNYSNWIKKYYPTEKFLKKNERKLIASILDMFEIKSKITIKIVHENNNIDIHSLARLCYFFGDNFSKYIASIDSIHFKNSNMDDQISEVGVSKFKFASELKKDSFLITNVEKENIVKIINSKGVEHNGFLRLTNEKQTHVNQRFIGDLYDHFKMIDKLREYVPDLHLKAKHFDEFHNEHMELSKMMKMIKKGWVLEYQFADKMVNDIETPIDLKIEMGNNEFGEITFYPHILKREEEYDEEGKFMHHCVATYSDKEKSIIISVRTQNKQDRVTCEFDCQTGNLIQARHFCNKQPPADIELAIVKLKEKTKYYARMGILHSLEKKKVPIKINGVEIISDHREPRKINDVLDDVFTRQF
jgi:hypothetical protein